MILNHLMGPLCPPKEEWQPNRIKNMKAFFTALSSYRKSSPDPH